MASAPAGEEAPFDSEIWDLLHFEPVPRKREVEGGWSPELQRQFIARLAVHGSATKACDEMGKNQTGIMKLYRSPLGASFRESWDAAVELAKRRRAEAEEGQRVAPGTRPPTIDHRFKRSPSPLAGEGRGEGAPGQVMNEYGEWEDEESVQRRAEEAEDSIGRRLLRIRRLYLQEISACPGKRAAFEILTELPIDWEIAARGGPQPDEPYRSASQREPDMVLMAESGWSWGEIGYGPDRKAQARAAMDAERAKKGLPAIDWSAED